MPALLCYRASDCRCLGILTSCQEDALQILGFVVEHPPAMGARLMGKRTSGLAMIEIGNVDRGLPEIRWESRVSRFRCRLERHHRHGNCGLDESPAKKAICGTFESLILFHDLRILHPW